MSAMTVASDPWSEEETFKDARLGTGSACRLVYQTRTVVVHVHRSEEERVGREGEREEQERRRQIEKEKRRRQRRRKGESMGEDSTRLDELMR